MLRKLGLVLLLTFVGVAGLEVGTRVATSGKEGIVMQAQAIIGRPLTPVSVAGVARRSVRRCAVGVNYC